MYLLNIWFSSILKKLKPIEEIDLVENAIESHNSDWIERNFRINI